MADPTELLLLTGLYGGPVDKSGAFVGSADYRAARGPTELADPQLERLQRLFDLGEGCYPADGQLRRRRVTRGGGQ